MASAPVGARARTARTVVGLLALLAALVPAAPAAATVDEGWYVAALVNDVRYESGQWSLGVDEQLSGIAQGWAEELAAGGYLAHNPDLSSAMWDWWFWGENVGYGGSLESIHSALLRSPWHYANIVSSDYTSIGVGVAYDAWGWVYVVQVFGG